MTSTIYLDDASIKGYSIWVASDDALDFSFIYARLYRKIAEHEAASEMQKYQFSHGFQVPYDSVDTLIIIDECLSMEGIPERIKIIHMTRLEARGHISSCPQLLDTDFKVLKLIERILLNQPEAFGLIDADRQLLNSREAYRQDIRRTTDGNSE